MHLVAGAHLGHYEIIAPVGAGGMGEVFEARDTKLKRIVAIKVLPMAVAQDPVRRDRFQREAEAIATLNHPNIVTIHAIEEANGVPFLVMELVNGEPLTTLIPKTGFSIDKLIALAVPLADAVAAAHQRGVLHRDIKPSNIMVAQDGRLKVLDFGLAKLTEGTPGAAGAADLATQDRTGEGRIVGTIAYMSPEQAEGRIVDQRSDLFSLGIVLYEMATGERPFRGENNVSVLSSIIKDTPPRVTDLKADIPPELGRIVRRCLEKDPTRRMQSALDLKNELEDLRSDMSSSGTPTNVLQPVARTTNPLVRARARVAWMAGAGALGLITAAVIFRPALKHDVLAPRLVNPVQITSAIGIEDFPTWSPDGTTVAYAAAQDGGTSLSGHWDIWVKPAGDGAPVNRTADHRGYNVYPSWSPDGSQIAFYSDRDGGGYYVMPAIGGTARRVLPMGGFDGGRGTRIGISRWLHGGSELACVIVGAHEDDTNVVIVSMATLETHTKVFPKSRFMLDPSWSPDEKLVAYVVTYSRTSEVTTLWVNRVEDGRRIALTDGLAGVWSPGWSRDGRVLFYVSNRGGTMDVWQQPMTSDGSPDGSAQAITTGIGIRHAAFSPNGQKLVYSKGQTLGNVWRVPILPDRPTVWSDAEQLTFDQAFIEFVDVSRDGKRLLVSSNRAGNQDLWIMPVGAGEPVQLTRDPAPDWNPKFSPDEREVVFYSYRTGGREVWVMPTDGGPARQLTFTNGGSGFVDWPRTGDSILFTHRDTTFSTGCVAAVPVHGGEPRCITSDGPDTFFPSGSPDGRTVAYGASRNGGHLFLADLPAGGNERALTKGPGTLPRWSPDGHMIYFRRPGDINGNLWAVSATGSDEHAMTNFSGRRGAFGVTALATDGRYLYFTWQEETGDLWIMDVANSKQ
jgi:eukaryotic-like serine/threonine-protein kinase